MIDKSIREFEVAGLSQGILTDPPPIWGIGHGAIALWRHRGCGKGGPVKLDEHLGRPCPSVPRSPKAGPWAVHLRRSAAPEAHRLPHWVLTWPTATW